MNSELEKAVRESGHNLHLRVAEVLRKRQWGVAMSQYYVDDISNKPREIDIVAWKKMIVHEDPGPDKAQYFLSLHIDCKYMPDEVAFWTTNNTLGVGAIQTRGGINRTEDIDKWSGLANHFYVQEKNMAILHEPTSGRDAIFDGMSQGIKSVLFAKDVGIQGLPAAGMLVPIVVYAGQDTIYEIPEGARDPVKGAKDSKPHHLYGVRFAHRDVHGDVKYNRFLVHFIHEKQLEKLLLRYEQLAQDWATHFVNKFENKYTDKMFKSEVTG